MRQEPGPHRRRLRPALFAALLCAAPCAAFAQQDTAATEISVQVVIDRGPSQLVFALERDSLLLLPARQVLVLMEIGIGEVVPGRSLSARFGPAGTMLILRTDSGFATGGTVAEAIAPGATIWREAELYVEAGLLGRLLGLELAVRWSDLEVTLAQTDRLPVVQRLDRERRRAFDLVRPAPSDVVDLWSRPRPVDGFTLDWVLNAASQDPLGRLAGSVGLGMTLLGGGLEVVQAASQGLPDSTGVRTPTWRRTAWTWQVAWERRRWLRQVRIGDLATGGPRGAFVRGAAISNVPYLRPAEFGLAGLVGRFDPGWQVEVYRSGGLLGYSGAGSDGQWRVPVSIVYGQNPLDVVAYGPHGEVVRRSAVFQIPTDRLPARQLEYDIAGGACKDMRCSASGTADLRYGVSNELTLRGGVQRFWRDSLPALLHPYGLVSYNPTRPINLTAELVGNAYARASVEVDPTADFHVDVSAWRIDTTVVQPILTPSRFDRQFDGALFVRPPLWRRAMYLRTDVVHRVGDDRHFTLGRVAVVGHVRSLRPYAELRWTASREGSSRATLQEYLAGFDGQVARRGPLGSAVLRGELGSDGRQLTSWRAGFGRDLLRTLRLDLLVRGDLLRGGVSGDLSITLNLPWMRAVSFNTYDAEFDEFSGQQQLEGTVLWDGSRGRLSASNGRDLGRGGVAGIVFLDVNGNGVRDDGERGLSDVLLRVGPEALVTDSLGRFRAWELVPFADAIIELDSLTLEDPSWYAPSTFARVAPRPNSFLAVEVPVAVGSEVSGRLLLDDRPLGGADVVAHHVPTGRLYRATTFSDGYFWIPRLPPGEVEIGPDAALLERLRAAGPPERLMVGPGMTLPREGITLRITSP